MIRSRRQPAAPPVLALLALALCAPRGLADDGSWVTERGYVPSEGALYSETGDPDVVMEKEYLELRDVGLGATRAVFQFHNTRSAGVIVECAFPIRFDFTARPITLDGNGKLVPDTESSVEGQQAPASYKAWDFGDMVPSKNATRQPSALQDKGFVKSLLAALSVRTDPWDAAAGDLYYAGTCFRDDQYPQGRKEMDPAKLLKLFGFHFLQDGRELPVETCVADFGAAPGQLVLHFRHQLSFTPDGTSVVSVTYAMPTRSAVSAEPTATRSPGVSRQFTWNYMLETASSWKDTLGRIVLAVPPGLHPDLDAPWQYLGTVEWRDTTADYPVFWRRVTEPLDPADLPSVDSPAKLLGASSSLPERTDVFLPQGIWRNVVERLRLADTREVQRFNASLPAGIYRAVIVDIYPGSRWNDTCLGELSFVRGTADGFDTVKRDPFFTPFLE